MSLLVGEGVKRHVQGFCQHFGLGLPIAHDAARRLGGTLTAANGPEGGAVFTVEFKKA